MLNLATGRRRRPVSHRVERGQGCALSGSIQRTSGLRPPLSGAVSILLEIA